jgi:hypothetical protein
VREETDLAEVAMARAVEIHLRELRAESNERVRAKVLEAEVKHLRDQLGTTTTTLKRIDRRRPTIWTAIATLVVAIAGLVAERITTSKVDERAEHAAEVKVEARAQPLEERATAAGSVSTETIGRQAELEAREAARDERMERLEAALVELTDGAARRKGKQ